MTARTYAADFAAERAAQLPRVGPPGRRIRPPQGRLASRAALPTPADLLAAASARTMRSSSDRAGASSHPPQGPQGTAARSVPSSAVRRVRRPAGARAPPQPGRRRGVWSRARRARGRSRSRSAVTPGRTSPGNRQRPVGSRQCAASAPETERRVKTAATAATHSRSRNSDTPRTALRASDLTMNAAPPMTRMGAKA